MKFKIMSKIKKPQFTLQNLKLNLNLSLNPIPVRR